MMLSQLDAHLSSNSRDQSETVKSETESNILILFRMSEPFICCLTVIQLQQVNFEKG